MASHSSILACEIPRTEEMGRLQSMGWQKSRNFMTTQRHCIHSGLFTGWACDLRWTNKSPSVRCDLIDGRPR